MKKEIEDLVVKYKKEIEEINIWVHGERDSRTEYPDVTIDVCSNIIFDLEGILNRYKTQSINK